MTTLTLGPFTGLDVRRQADAADPRSLRVAEDIELTVDGSIQARPAWRKIITLPSNTIGLYSLGGRLRTIGWNTYADRQSGAYATGSITLTAQPSDGNTVTISDGTHTATVFEFDNNASVGGSNISVGIASDKEGTIANLITAINGVTTSLTVTAAASLVPDNVCNLTADSKDFTHNVTITKSGANITVAGMSGGYSVSYSDMPGVLIPAEVAIVVDQVSGTGYTDMTAALPYGGDQAFGVYPYVVLYDGSNYQHHWVRPAIADTRISLPFNPGPAAIKMANKVFAPDKTGTAIRFSSTLNGPTDWIEESDAGFLPVSTHATGDRTVNGLGYYDNYLAVIFDDSVQLWSVSPDPALHALWQVLNGVGTPYVRTAVNVRGDLVYLSRGGFENLRTVTETGRIEPDSQLGAPIQPLTEVFDVTKTVPVSCWWSKSAKYLCAVEDEVFAYTKFAGSIDGKKGGWTHWTAPADIDYMVELNGELYVRCGNDLYILDPAGTEATTFDAQTQFLDGKKPGLLKLWQTIDAAQNGTVTTRLFPLSKYPTTYETGPNLIESTDVMGDIPLMLNSEVLSVGMRGTVGGGDDRWRCDRLTLRYIPLRG